MSFAALTIDLNARLNKFEQDLSKAGKGLDGLNTRVGSIANSFNKAFGALGIGLGVVGFVKAVKGTIDLADHLNDLNKITGVSVSTLAGLKVAAEQSGTDIDVLAKGIAKLGVNLINAQSGNDNLAKTFKQLGITGTNSTEAFYKLADRIERTTSAEERNKIVTEAIGKKFVDLIPILSEGGDKLRKLADESETYQQAMAKLAPDADKFNDLLAKMKGNFLGVGSAIIGAALPSLNEYLGALQEILKTGSLLDKVKFFSVGFIPAKVLDQIGDASERVAAYRAEVERLKARKPESWQPLVLKIEWEKQMKEAETGLQAMLEKQVVGLNKPVKSKLAAIDFTDVAKGKKKTFDKNAFGFDALQQGMEDAAKELESFSAAREADQEEWDHYRATLAEVKDQQKEWTDAVKESTSGVIDLIDPTAKLIRQLDELDKLKDFGIDPEVIAAARLEINAQIDDLGYMKDKLQEMDEFSKNAAESMQRSFSDFFFDPMENGFKGMVKNFGDAILRMVADAAAADLTRALFGGNDKQGGGSAKGGLLDIFSSAGKLFSFDTGTDFVPQDMIAKIHKGERIIPARQNNGSRGVNITVNVNGNNNAPDVRRAAAQGAREAMGLMSGAQRYA